MLNPTNVSNGSFGSLWNSEQFDSVTLSGITYAPHLYASPLYVDSVKITGGTYTDSSFGVVFAATSTGYVYAVKAFDQGSPSTVPNGTILWRKSLGTPSSTLDGGVTVGVLGTPIIDTTASPPRLYVASDVTDSDGRNWKVFALNLGSGDILSGWPLTINNTTLAPINQNGPAIFQPASAMSQRSALNLSPDNHILYVPFGAYGDGGAGWMVAVDTTTPKLASAFSGAPTNVKFANAGMWGAGGPAIDSNGTVYDTTGNSPSGSKNAAQTWGNSLLAWKSTLPLQLSGTYTPWNYCQMDDNDTDLAGGTPMLLPDLGSGNTSTPHVVAFGGKQGNAYLVDQSNLPGNTSSRPACSTASSSDTSLIPPGNQPQFTAPGPLNVFGPYSEDSNNSDFAKARSTPAYFQGGDSTPYVFYSGSTKTAIGQTSVKPPSLARLKVVTASGKRAYFALDATDTQLQMLTPGSPVVASNGSSNAIVWVIDANVLRSQSLIGPNVPHPVLYAVDAQTMKVLWSSTPDQLNVGGKYSQPTIARGIVFVGTDRIQAFGLKNSGPIITTVDDSVIGTGRNQFTYTGRGWFHCSSGCITGSYNATVSATDTTNDYATITFNGTGIKLFTDQRNNRGIAGISIDGGAESNVDMYSASDAGNVLIWTSPTLGAGNHILKVRNTGAHNTKTTGTRVAIDRVDIIS